MRADLDEISGAHRSRSARPTMRVLVVLLVAACARAPDGGGWDVLMPAAADAETTRIAGPVTYIDLEGGLFVIRGSDGTNSSPTNLPEAYRDDGLSVQADVVRRDDAASIGMVGPIVDIVRIRRAEGEGAAENGDE